MGTKVCAKCSEMKPLDAFSKMKASKDGKQRQCKQCIANYHKDNRESRKSYAREYFRKYYQANKEALRKYQQEDKAARTARQAKRRACKIQATPKWANLSKIEGLYKLAQYLTEEHGRQIHVDHIVPLQNPLVCGLHVEDNLQLLFAEDNISKSNSFKVS